MQYKTAIVLGATGLTGRLLVKELLNDLRYEKVKLFSRTPMGFEHPNMEEFIVDVLNLDKFQHFFIGDEVFCCIGTTKSKTPDQPKYTAIDFGIPAKAAALCRAKKIPTFVVVSSMGANPKSRFFYQRVKGLMEEAVQNAAIPNTYILRPSLILGKRKEERKGENWAQQFFGSLSFTFVGFLKKYKPIKASDIVKAMILLPNMKYKSGVYKSHQLIKIAKRYGGN